jgi:hypothetical protein
MPHYKDWSGTSWMEIPQGSASDPTASEYWAAFDSVDDLLAAASTHNWSSYDAQNPPNVPATGFSASHWVDAGLDPPDAFAALVGYQGDTNGTPEINYMVWDVQEPLSTMDYGPSILRSEPWTLTSLTSPASGPSYVPIDQLYFNFNSPTYTVPEPNTGLLLSIALGASLLLRSVRRMLRFSA